MNVSERAKRLLKNVLLDYMELEEQDWLEFPDDRHGDGPDNHPVHGYRELYAYVTGGRYPYGSSHRFTNEEFLYYTEGKCGWTVGPSIDWRCGQPVENSTGFYCETHARGY